MPISSERPHSWMCADISQQRGITHAQCALTSNPQYAFHVSPMGTRNPRGIAGFISKHTRNDNARHSNPARILKYALRLSRERNINWVVCDERHAPAICSFHPAAPQIVLKPRSRLENLLPSAAFTHFSLHSHREKK
jgi:hypothetical protein